MYASVDGSFKDLPEIQNIAAHRNLISGDNVRDA